MNYFFKATTVLAFSCFFNLATANTNTTEIGDPTLIFEAKEEANSLVFELNSLEKESEIKIANSSGYVLFKEAITSPRKYRKKFNLKNLPEGQYNLTAENELRSIMYTIDVKEGKAKMVDKNIAYKPTFKQVDNKILVNLLNISGEKVRFDIYDSNGKTVHKETVKNTVEVSKTFNLSKSLKGTYDLRVWDANGIHSQSFTIK